MTSRKAFYALALLTGLGTILAIWRGAEIRERLFDLLGGIDREYYGKMKSIGVGMSENDIVTILGAPASISTEPEVKEWHGDPGLYGKAIPNKNKVLIYHHGIDISGHYFLDEHGKVFLVNVGGT